MTSVLPCPNIDRNCTKLYKYLEKEDNRIFQRTIRPNNGNHTDNIHKYNIVFFLFLRSYEHKSQPDLKKIAKSKHGIKKNNEDKYKITTKIETNEKESGQHEGNTSMIKSQMKIAAPSVKRKQNRITNTTAATDIDDRKQIQSQLLEEDGQIPRRFSGQSHHHKIDNTCNYIADYHIHNAKRNTTVTNKKLGQSLSSSLRNLNNKSPSAINKVETDISKTSERTSFGSIPAISPILRQTKSEVYYSTKSPSNEKAQTKERFCYERRLKKLEDEIERYKNDVKSFCRDTFNYSKQRQVSRTCEDVPSNKLENEIVAKNNNYQLVPKRKHFTNTPIKNIYYQLLTKGNHHDSNKSDLISGNTDCREQYIQLENNSLSGRTKEIRQFDNHNQPEQQLQMQHNCRISQQRYRPVSKFT